MYDTTPTAPASDEAYISVVTRIRELVAYLDRPIWRECRPTCNYEEVCVLPIWPLTARVEDRKHPKCKNAKAFAKRMMPGNRSENYWWEDDEFHNPKGPPQRKRAHGKARKLESRTEWRALC